MPSKAISIHMVVNKIKGITLRTCQVCLVAIQTWAEALCNPLAHKMSKSRRTSKTCSNLIEITQYPLHFPTIRAKGLNNQAFQAQVLNLKIQLR